jgi:hypothetical protein
LHTPKTEKPWVTEPAPFTFKTDERLKSQKSVEDSELTSAFKARPVPNYKFFEVKHNHDQERSQVVFKEFNLATANIRRIRSNS